MLEYCILCANIIYYKFFWGIKMKKLFKFLFSLALTLCISSSLLIENTEALENDLTSNSICLEEEHEHDSNECEFTVGYEDGFTVGYSNEFNSNFRAVMYCPNSPELNKYHQMKPKGIGVLYRYNPTTGAKTLVFNNGGAYQCPYCFHVVVMQEVSASTIGYYATWNPGGSVSGTGVVLSASTISYASGNTLRGYKFY